MDVGDDFPFKWGAVTLLDFLGWKGVWLNDYKQQSMSSGSNRNSLLNLIDLIKAIRKECFVKCKKCGKKLEFISISDTIALFSPCKGRDDDEEDYGMLKLHAEMCSQVMDMSANAGFALRGAITIGEYACLKNVIVGPGVDECASWHEQADWLGVIFAPSAQFIIDVQRSKNKDGHDNVLHGESKRHEIDWCDGKIVAYEHIPIKNGFRGIGYCVDWGSDGTILNKVLKNTISLSREIAIKYRFLHNSKPQ